MIRFAIIVLIMLFTNISIAGDRLSIVFEDHTISSGNKRVKCNLYYVLLGDNGSLKRGDLIQITQRHDDLKRYQSAKGRFTVTDTMDQITIYWSAQEGERLGNIEKARMKIIDSKTNRISYEIFQHSDQTQEGQKLKAELVAYERLPKWVRGVVHPSIIAKLPPEMQIRYHRIQAEYLDAMSEIIRAYTE